MKWLFSITIFTGAALLFLVQPMVAKLLLPAFGGASVVWNTCMVFFQATLLIGYVYAHLIGGRGRSGGGGAAGWPVAVHALVLVMPLAVLPLALPADYAPEAEADPVWPLLAVLAGMALLPAAVMATTGPLIQAWYTRTGAADAHDPYFLYSASNAGSLMGLLGYPFVVERLIPLSQQGRAWAWAYGVYAALVLACGVMAWVRSRSAALPGATGTEGVQVSSDEKPTRARRVAWLLLAFGPSCLTLGATQFISTDVGSFPLMWILPLTAYIASFMVAFSPRGASVVRVCRVAAPLLAVLAGGAAMVGTSLAFLADNLALLLALHVGLVFAGSVAAHARLYELRPAASRLTEFYLLIAVGGVLGGGFNALAAPLVFQRVWEYPLAIALVLVLGTRGVGVPGLRFMRGGHDWRWWRLGLDVLLPVCLFFFGGLCMVIASQYQLPMEFERPMLQNVVPMLAALLLINRPLRVGLAVLALFAVADRNQWFFADVLHRARTYYGVHMVYRDGKPPVRTLSHGTTKHTVQSEDPRLGPIPQAYYHPSGPVGQVFKRLRALPERMNVALVGMGGGALAAYSRAGDRFVFYEIDPEVRRIALDRRLFTYVPDAAGSIEVVMGDARLSLRTARDGEYDLIVLDAFSADSVPTHLLTREAFEMYRAKLKPDGLIAVHVSNRFYRLGRPVVAVADALGMRSMFWFDGAVSAKQAEAGKAVSVWAAVSPSAAALEPYLEPEKWSLVSSAEFDAVYWTDDFTNPLSALSSWW